LFTAKFWPKDFYGQAPKEVTIGRITGAKPLDLLRCRSESLTVWLNFGFEAGFTLNPVDPV
jgi:hypothetical protein